MTAARENHREAVAGRSDVEDTAELLAYYEELETLKAGALWTVANKIEPWEPVSRYSPVLWPYDKMRSHVLRAIDLVTPEKAGRRVIYLNNPGAGDRAACVGGIYSGLQVMKAGETASAHAHSTSAMRFIMEGRGAYTIVDGHKMTLGANDLVLTPNGTWHEHGIDPEGTTCIWQDCLDIPLVNTLEANFYAVHPDMHQKVGYAVDDTKYTFGAPGLQPQVSWDKAYSPLYKYEWGPTYEALVEYSKVTDGSPYDGILMNYVNPRNNGPVMLTLGASMQLLRAGEKTKAHRHTGNVIYQVAKGSGYSIIGGQRFDWKEKDIFCVPSWAFHEHANGSSSDDACLFAFNDFPVMNALGLYREQAFGDNDGHQKVEA